MALEATKPYYQVSSSHKGFIYTLIQNFPLPAPLWRCLTPALEGLAFLPCRGLCQFFPCSAVAEGNQWHSTCPLQDPEGVWSETSQLSPFSSALIVGQIVWRVEEGRLEPLQLGGSFY